MNHNPYTVGSILKSVSLGVMLMLSWFIGTKKNIPTSLLIQTNTLTEIRIINAETATKKGFVKNSSYTVQLGRLENQIGFMPYQEKVQPGYAQGALPTEFFRKVDGITWIGDPYGPRLTAWSQDGKYQKSIDLPFLKNEASQKEKEIVGYTVKPMQDRKFIVLNHQNKKVYSVDENSMVTQILSIPLVLSENRVILTISPFFELINDEWIFITVESSKQPFLTLKGFANGEYIDSVWESFFISFSGKVIGPLPEQTSVLQMKKGFIIWSYKQKELYLDWYADPRNLNKPGKTWIIQNPLWHYGGLIGADDQDCIYFWADQSVIGKIHTRWDELVYGTIPAQDFFPVNVTPDGEIGWIQAGKESLQVCFVKMIE